MSAPARTFPTADANAPVVHLEAVVLDGRPAWLPPDAVVFEDDVAKILRVSERTVKRMDIVRSYAVKARPSMFWGDVVAYLKRHRAA